MKIFWTFILGSIIGIGINIYFAPSIHAQSTISTQQIIRNGKVESVKIVIPSTEKTSNIRAIQKKQKAPSKVDKWSNRSTSEIKESFRQQQKKKKNPFYIIQQGDTLSVLALTLNTNINYLIDLNQIENPDFIITGQKIRFR